MVQWIEYNTKIEINLSIQLWKWMIIVDQIPSYFNSPSDAYNENVLPVCISCILFPSHSGWPPVFNIINEVDFAGKKISACSFSSNVLKTTKAETDWSN